MRYLQLSGIIKQHSRIRHFRGELQNMEHVLQDDVVLFQQDVPTVKALRRCYFFGHEEELGGEGRGARGR